MRLIDADALKKLRHDYIQGRIKFDGSEYDLIDKCPTIEVEPTLRKLLSGEWVDTEEVQTSSGIDFATGMSLFELSREAEWNAPPLNGQKITTKFRLKAEPVKHGRWENHPHQLGFVRCSVCHDCIICGEWADGTKWQYCPNCGADMRGMGNE